MIRRIVKAIIDAAVVVTGIITILGTGAAILLFAVILIMMATGIL